jgi:hypothetical protein
MTLTERISAIEARANAATEGPWNWNQHGDGENKGHYYVHTASGGHGYLEVAECPPYMTHDEPNAYFIAAARSDVPALCSALRLACETLTHQYNQACKLGREGTVEALDAALASIESIIGGKP